MILRFGVFELDALAGELRRSGVRIRIQDQPLRILRELLDRRGEVVTRDELRSKIWGDTFVEYDRALNTAVKKLRDALSDSAEAPRYVETLARKGYRFVAPVEVVEAEPVERPALSRPGSGDNPSIDPAGGLRARRSIVAAVIALVIVATTASFLLRAPTADIRSLAVLPFANMTGSAANDYLADGLTESLISDLANIRSLRVISRTSAMQYRDAGKPLPQIASELDVEGVVEGAVVRLGERTRIEVKLIDARRDALLWSDEFERPSLQLDLLQRDVAAAVAAQLRTRIDSPARAENAETLLETMRALHWLRQKRDGPNATRILQQAIARDPTSAAPWAALAEVEMFGPAPDVSPLDSLQRAKHAAERAVALDPQLSDAHAVLGLVRMFLERDFAAAERAFQRAIELKPGAAEPHRRYGVLLTAMGRLEQAIEENRRAVELDPLSALALDDYGRALYFARRYDEAIVQYERALATDPHDQIAMWFRVYALVAAKRHDEAVDQTAEIMRRSGGAQFVPRLHEVYRAGGWPAVSKAWAELDRVRFQNAPFVRSTGIASRYAQAGERELAMEWLERAYRSHTRDLLFLRVEPAFDPVRDDPRFTDVVRRVTSSSAP